MLLIEQSHLGVMACVSCDEERPEWVMFPTAVAGVRFHKLASAESPSWTPNQPILLKATFTHLLCHRMQYVRLITSIIQFTVIGKTFRVELENANRDTSNKIKSVKSLPMVVTDFPRQEMVMEFYFVGGNCGLGGLNLKVWIICSFCKVIVLHLIRCYFLARKIDIVEPYPFRMDVHKHAGGCRQG